MYKSMKLYQFVFIFKWNHFFLNEIWQSLKHLNNCIYLFCEDADMKALDALKHKNPNPIYPLENPKVHISVHHTSKHTNLRMIMYANFPIYFIFMIISYTYSTVSKQ